MDDVRVALPAVRAPTHVLHRAWDRAIRVGNGRFIAEHIPNAKYVELPGDDHWWWVGDADKIVAEIEEFVQGLKAPSPSDQVLATILALTVTSKQRSGIPTLGGDVLRRYDQGLDYQQALDAQIARWRGRLAKTNGQWIILFDGPSRALQCARAVCRVGMQMGIPIRAGLHTGQVGGDGTEGLAVPIAENLVQQATAGEVLVTSTVKDLVIGAGFRFQDRGEENWQAIPGTWHLYALDTASS